MFTFSPGVVTPHAIAQLLNFLMGSYGQPRLEDDTGGDSNEIGQFTFCNFLKMSTEQWVSFRRRFATHRIQPGVSL